MASNTTTNTVETLVGAAVIAVAVGFFFYASQTAGVGGGVSGGYKVVAEFDNAQGVSVGTDVRLAGVKIGTAFSQPTELERTSRTQRC